MSYDVLKILSSLIVTILYYKLCMHGCKFYEKSNHNLLIFKKLNLHAAIYYHEIDKKI